MLSLSGLGGPPLLHFSDLPYCSFSLLRNSIVYIVDKGTIQEESNEVSSDSFMLLIPLSTVQPREHMAHNHIGTALSL